MFIVFLCSVILVRNIKFLPVLVTNFLPSVGTESYITKTRDYRQNIVRNLHKFASDFINCIKDAMMSFPAPLKWLIAHINHLLVNSGRYDELQSELIYYTVSLLVGYYTVSLLVG